MKKPETHGGARKGAGRPPKTGRTESVTWRISPEAVANIKGKAAEKKSSPSALVDDWARKLKLKKT
jgi:hypothetical protein